MNEPTRLGRVVALGAYILDVLGRPIDTIPTGDTSAVIEEIAMTVAGTAGATAVDLAKLGVDVVAVGAIGDDGAADFLISTLHRYGVDTALLLRQPGLRTTASILPIRANGERPVWHMRAAMNQLTAHDVDALDFTSIDVLHVGGPDALGRFAGEPLRNLMARAREQGARITMDLLGPTGERSMERLEPLLAFVDDFMPNDSQLEGLCGTHDLDAAAELVLGLGVNCVFVTRGERGSAVISADASLRLPAVPARTVDTTGCGDAYSAGVIVGRLLGWDAERSAQLGSVAGAQVAEGLGSDAGITDLASALARLGTPRPPDLPAGVDSPHRTA